MKFVNSRYLPAGAPVTLYVRVWIEINESISVAVQGLVTLYVRVWIEIPLPLLYTSLAMVTLYVRVWIEIYIHAGEKGGPLRHPLREGVD